MKKEYDFSKGKRGEFYQPSASIKSQKNPEMRVNMNSIQNQSDIFQQFSKQIQTLLGKELKQVILFGSRARGTASEDSDYDCLVVVEHLSNAVKNEIDEIMGSLLYDYGILLSAILVTEERFEKSLFNPLFINIRKEGQTLWPNPNN